MPAPRPAAARRTARSGPIRRPAGRAASSPDRVADRLAELVHPQAPETVRHADRGREPSSHERARLASTRPSRRAAPAASSARRTAAGGCTCAAATQCGHVGCCDTSPAQHATAHFRATGHPVVQSFEPGEDWFWDYTDETGVARPRARAAHQRVPRTSPCPALPTGCPTTGGTTSTEQRLVSRAGQPIAGSPRPTAVPHDHPRRARR